MPSHPIVFNFCSMIFFSTVALNLYSSRTFLCYVSHAPLSPIKQCTRLNDMLETFRETENVQQGIAPAHSAEMPLVLQTVFDE
jgi:hypothetical protein